MVVATGAAYDHLPGTARPVAAACAGSGSRCSRRRRSPGTLTTSVADADTLRYYPAYEVGSARSVWARRTRWPPSTTSSSCWCSASTAG